MALYIFCFFWLSIFHFSGVNIYRGFTFGFSIPVIVLLVTRRKKYPEIDLIFRNSTIQLKRFLARLRQADSSIFISLGLLVFLSSSIVLTHFQHYYDVLSYHLPLAHELVQSGLFSLDQYDYYQSLPYGAFLLYAPVLSNPDTTIYDAGVWPLLWIALLNCAFLASRICGQFGAAKWVRNVAFLMVVLYPSMWKAFYLTQTDLLTALFALAGFERLISSLKTRSKFSFLLAGILFGSTYAIKQSALAIYIIPAILFCVVALIGMKDSIKPKHVGLFLLGIFLTMLPWLHRSFVHTGNPLFPLLGTHETWTAEQQEFLLSNHERVSPLSAEYFVNLWENLKLFGYPLQLMSPNGLVTLLPPIGILSILGVIFLKKRKFALCISYLLVLSGYGALCLVGLAPLRFGLGLSLISICLGLVIMSKVFENKLIYAYASIGLVTVFTVLAYFQTYLEGWKSEVWNPNIHFPVEIIEAQNEERNDQKTWVLFENRERLFSGETVSGKVWNPMPYAELLKASESPLEFKNKLIEEGVQQIVVNDQELGRLVDFYGDETETNPLAWAEVGVMSDPDKYARRIALYPPARFSDLSEKECLLLSEFLRQTFLETQERYLLYRPEPDQVGRPQAFAAIWVAKLN